VFLSYGRGSTGRAVAPPSAPTPQKWKRWAREWKKFAASREARRRRLAPPLEIAAVVAGGLNVFRRVQRRGSFAGKDGF